MFYHAWYGEESFIIIWVMLFQQFTHSHPFWFVLAVQHLWDVSYTVIQFMELPVPVCRPTEFLVAFQKSFFLSLHEFTKVGNRCTVGTPKFNWLAMVKTIFNIFPTLFDSFCQLTILWQHMTMYVYRYINSNLITLWC